MSDLRRAHGDATRNRIMVSARAVAGVHGLDGVTIGRLAATTGLSKAGVFAHYGSKEALQAAVIDDALLDFETRVIAPTLAQPAGLRRIRAFVDAYLRYVSCDDNPGGCFFTAATVEFAHRPGPIRDRLAEIRASWFRLTTAELAAAHRAEELRDATDVDQLAYELILLLQGANTAYQVSDDPIDLDRGRRAIRHRLDAVAR